MEWDVSMIGHTPFIMEQMFTVRLKDEHSMFLNCRMRIHNQTADVVPMYWRSNMAVWEDFSNLPEGYIELAD